MSKELALNLFKILSALEALGCYQKESTPDYLFDNIVNTLNDLEKIILDKQ